MRIKKWVLAISLVSAGCTGQGHVKVAGEYHGYGAVTTHMDECVVGGASRRPKKSERVGVLRVVLPPSLNLSQVPRLANYDANDKEENEDDDPAKDPMKNDNEDTATGRQIQPFHVYLKNKNIPYTGFLVVKIIIKEATQYGFVRATDETGIEGVGWGGPDAVGKICGSHVVTRPRGREFAIFYVDMSKFANGTVVAPFNIGIRPDNHKETPIFIDPKVRNDG